MFSSLKKELNSAATSIKKEVGLAANMAEDAWGESQGVMKETLRTGNVVQLVSCESGKTLQIVTATTGHLVVDGRGSEGPQFFNANWTVYHEGGNRIKLSNNNNYLCIINGNTVLKNFPPGSTPDKDTTLRVTQKQHFVCLHANEGPRAYVGVRNNGELKSASATGTDKEGQWAVKVIQAAPKVVQGQQTVVVQQQMHPAPYGAQPGAYAAQPAPYGAQAPPPPPGQQQHTVTMVNARPGQQIIIQQGQQAQKH